MNRRDFIQFSSLLGLGITIPSSPLLAIDSRGEGHSKAYRELVYELLKEWCDGMIARQLIDPSDPKIHGLMQCPACDVVHARFFDAVYPLFYMAKTTGQAKYLDAGIAAMEWNRNVTLADGSWTNDLDPKSWNGTTVFGAIALAETLKYHGDLLDSKRYEAWQQRLRAAGDFIYRKFDAIDVTNVNYGATNIYALDLIGKLLELPHYRLRSKELAEQIKGYFTEPNKLLFGEIKPSAHKKSAKGLPGVDLGYNVEESLNSIVMYALHAEDKELIGLVQKSMESHLEFMLPDGGWDNSWGTRMFKWTYWGSRTCDGCQPAFTMMAGHNPAFGTAAVKNTELLRRCTADGLLHGGPHYISRGIKPCLHHTFTHAKALATVLDQWDELPPVNTNTPLPRAEADGVHYFKELDTALFARGAWRGTVSAYDAEYYHKRDMRQATGNSLGILYHEKVGLLCAASMAIYKLMEPLNQQPAPGEDIALTPRIETYQNGNWYSNLFDLTSTFDSTDSDGKITVQGQVALKNERREKVQNTAADFGIAYECTAEHVRITGDTTQELVNETSITVPVLSPSGELMGQPEPNFITIQKPEGTVYVSANVPLEIKEMGTDRTFNMVPGVEAIPIVAFFTPEQKRVEIEIKVI
ncbi:hypothetical protein DN752_23425 [Echinicola strongylocentroti]|uniref:Uncharacterized protein n=1 Tax=Echinicola strongylocentroti TaxID=1795355 RepID=A0A2Z4IP26_9BACT|nr:hypothetical protein [Echinicola strongylocentroti]AWW32852.1 hypothetical protein DN752_23425 [Echinicola strongylocentroti]